MVAKLGKYSVVLTVDDLVALTAAHSGNKKARRWETKLVENLAYLAGLKGNYEAV